MSSDLSSHFAQQAVHHLRQDFLPKLSRCVELLDNEQLWWRPNESSNSVGNLILHLCGNLRQWILAGIDGQPDLRRRELEFSSRELLPGPQLMQQLQAVVDEACRVILACNAEQLQSTRRIQIYDVTCLQAIFHVVEHFSCHTGQIIFVTKMLGDIDLGFYSKLDRSRAPKRKLLGRELPPVQ